jgi:hypothetical protein
VAPLLLPILIIPAKELIPSDITHEYGSFPVERAALGACDLSVLHVGGEWQRLVRRDGHDVAEGTARADLEAREQAEAVALSVTA